VAQDDLLYRFRLRTFALAAELGNVRAAGRAIGASTLYLVPVEAAAGPARPEILRPRERRVPQIANQASELVE
jgi:predicted xylose isomerase-like sugar epimerase